MAQSRSFFDDVKRELECSVCQEQFSETNEPKILKCLHTSCKSCLEACLRQQGGGTLSCPTCRQITDCPNNNISSLPSNLFYKQMVDIVKAYSGQGQEDSPQCGNCDERKSLKFYCANCNHFLCDDCAGAHRKMKALNSHQVKEIGKFKLSDARDYARRANVCKNDEHNDELRFYCEHCVICICRDCAILDHRDHSIVSLDNGLQKKKSEIENMMQEVQANVSRLRSEKESHEKQRIRMSKSVEQATEEIHRTAERNIELIRQHEAGMIERLMKRKDTFEAAFSNTVTDLDEKLNETVSSLDFGNEVLERNNLPEILNVQEVLEQRFQKLMEPCAFSLKVNYSAVKYVSNDLSSLKDSPGKLITTNTEPSSTMVDGMGLTEGVQGEDCTFTMITNDLQGNKTHSEIDRVEVCIQSTQRRENVKVSITNTKDGCYKVSYKPDAAGEFKVHIAVAGEAINGSPFQLKVKQAKEKTRRNRVESTVSERVMKGHHVLGDCELELKPYRSDKEKTPQVFSRVTAVVNFGMFQLSFRELHNLLEKVKNEAGINWHEDSDALILTGMFDQVQNANRYLQEYFGRRPYLQLTQKEEAYSKDAGNTKQNAAGFSCKVAKITDVFEVDVQPVHETAQTRIQEDSARYGKGVLLGDVLGSR